ncbi:MAG: hypothetical protein LBV06_01455 [Propionibacteriaceae bacterium]|jgi:hypothetical protein|nr:hypothetical protein [Propionibacteriaceae bacterium]
MWVKWIPLGIVVAVLEALLALYAPLIAIWLGLMGSMGVVTALVVHSVSGWNLRAWLIYLLGGFPVGALAHYGYFWFVEWAWCLTERCG